MAGAMHAPQADPPQAATTRQIEILQHTLGLCVEHRKPPGKAS